MYAKVIGNKGQKSTEVQQEINECCNTLSSMYT